MTRYIVLALIVGILFGNFFVAPSLIPSFEIALEWALTLLLFTVGFELGFNKDIGKQLRTLPKISLLLPFVIAIASIASGMLVTTFIELKPIEGAAVASGFGWYSLSGLLIAQSYSTSLGTLAFLTNIMRELIAIVTIPLVAKHLGYLSAIAPGGATAMDVTLPLISRNTDAQTTLAAVYSGTILSLLVPVIVPLLVRLAQLLS